jgi:UDP-N-acetylglucosamine 4,6-dehydratase/5-epimerase
VADSRGSVIPLFRDQAKTGRITVTDVRMTRFLITIPQAVDFVLGRLEDMEGGEIFVPRMPSLTIGDLATAIAPDCKREYVGVRPGEKLAEVLVSADEAYRTVDMGNMLVILPAYSFWSGGKRYLKAARVPEGWSYTSANNTEWLTVEQLREMANAG